MGSRTILNLILWHVEFSFQIFPLSTSHFPLFNYLSFINQLDMKFIVTTFALLLFLASCGSADVASTKEGDAELTVAEQHMTLSESDLFDGPKIQLYLKKDTLNAHKANQAFLDALDLFKNKKDLTEAEKGFKASILTYPTGAAYYELGNVSMEKEDYELALKCYRMAENLNYEPFAKLLYNIACVYSHEKDYELSAQYLEYAVQAGYLNVDNIEKDPDLELLRSEANYLYSSHLKRALNGTSDAETIYWLQYKKHFTQAEFPLKVDELFSKTQMDFENSISYDFEKYVPQMRDGKFSREVSKNFYYYTMVGESKDYVAVIYMIRDAFMDEDAPLSYRLVTYTHKGKMIDEYLIAGRENYTDDLRSAVVKKDMTCTIDLYKTEFERDVEEHGPYNNKIVSKTKIGQEKIKIGSNGEISSVTLAQK